jgi:hypothetical protein
MPLLGPAAMLLSFDVAPEAIPEHDHWHTYEHLPERLSIPGFFRGTRWIAVHGQPRYMVLYEVEQLGTLESEAYLQRLNNPTPWTMKTMPHYRGMNRGFCSVTGSFGLGMGHLALLVRFKPELQATASLREWLMNEGLPQLPAKRGLGSVHLLEGALTPAMTNEQRIRGADTPVAWAVLATGYSEEALRSFDLESELAQRGATGVVGALYRFDYSLSCDEIGA